MGENRTRCRLRQKYFDISGAVFDIDNIKVATWRFRQILESDFGLIARADIDFGAQRGTVPGIAVRGAIGRLPDDINAGFIGGDVDMPAAGGSIVNQFHRPAPGTSVVAVIVQSPIGARLAAGDKGIDGAFIIYSRDYPLIETDGPIAFRQREFRFSGSGQTGQARRLLVVNHVRVAVRIISIDASDGTVVRFCVKQPVFSTVKYDGRISIIRIVGGQMDRLADIDIRRDRSADAEYQRRHH